MARGHVFVLFFFLCFFFDVVCLFIGFFTAVVNSSVLLGLELLLPGLVQVNQSLVVEDKEDEVQRVRGDADDAQVLEDEVEDVAQVERAHHRHDGRGHEDQGRHRADRHSWGGGRRTERVSLDGPAAQRLRAGPAPPRTLMATL